MHDMADGQAKSFFFLVSVQYHLQHSLYSSYLHRLPFRHRLRWVRPHLSGEVFISLHLASSLDPIPSSMVYFHAHNAKIGSEIFLERVKPVGLGSLHMLRWLLP